MSRVDGDPIGSEAPRGKSRHQRKSAKDGKHWTPSEERKRDVLMKQFCKLEGPSGNSEAYITAACWCSCGRSLNRRGRKGGTIPCVKCRPDLKGA